MEKLFLLLSIPTGILITNSLFIWANDKEKKDKVSFDSTTKMRRILYGINHYDDNSFHKRYKKIKYGSSYSQSCDSYDTWQHGNSLVNFKKLVTFGNLNLMRFD